MPERLGGSNGVIFLYKGGKGVKMEKIKTVRMTLHIETDKRKVDKDFGNLFDMKIFMDSFFTAFAERRASESVIQYVEQQKRMRVE